MRCTTLTLHPSVDRVVEVDRLVPGALLEGRLLRAVPAGKGVNTARSLKSLLGCSATVCAGLWLGANEQPFFTRALKREGIAAATCPREVLTRVCLTYLARRGRGQAMRETHIKELMPPPTGGARGTEAAALLQFCQGLPLRGRLVAICGSAPPGTPAALLKRVLSELRGASPHAQPRALIADTNGAFLKAAAAAGLDGLKGNGDEIGAWLGLGQAWTPARGAHRRALVEALHAGTTGSHKNAPRAVMVTLGARGAALVTRDGGWIAAPPAVPKSAMRSATGCGDAATAGWLWALGSTKPSKKATARCDPAHALACAVACGTAKLLSEDPGRLSAKQVRSLLKRVRVQKMG